MVTDVIGTTAAAGLDGIRMSDATLAATLALRAFLFQAVYENDVSTVEFRKASAILAGLWEKVHERPTEFLDRRTLELEGVDAAARDFLAGMTDRFAVGLFEQLFIPKPWVDLPREWQRD
jgi:dGTPase